MRKDTIATFCSALFLSATVGLAQNNPPTGTLALPAPLGVPQPVLQGGVVVPLYPPGSPFLKMERVREAEYYNLSKAVPGRISWITNIHNPSIEVHTVEGLSLIHI